SLLLLFACGQEAERSAKPLSSDTLTATQNDSTQRQAAPDLPTYDKRILFEGEIGDYPVEMELEITGDEIRGSYRYTSQQARLKLEGKVDEVGDYVMAEYTAEGEKTGLLIGEQGFQGRFTGSWMKTDSTGELLLLLYPSEVIERNINEYTPPELRYQVNHIKKVAENGTCEIDIFYPFFFSFPDGLAERINSAMMGPSEAEVAQQLSECQSDNDPDAMPSVINEGFTINGFVGPIMSITTDFYAYFSGAAHGNYGSETQNFDMRTGQLLEAKDIFAFGYQKALSELFGQRLMDTYPEDHNYFSYTGIAEEQDFEFFADSVAVYFDPYEIAPYAAGQIKLKVGYDEIEAYIREDGPLGLR
ncbi:MAG: RsiV family protein, partial [Bacteroidota bacterium]